MADTADVANTTDITYMADCHASAQTLDSGLPCLIHSLAMKPRRDRSLVQRREKLAGELEDLRRRVSRIETAIAGIDALMELDNEEPPRFHIVSATDVGDSKKIKDVILHEAIEQPSPFTAPVLCGRLQHKFPDRSFNPTTVSHTLRRAAQEGLFRIVEQGSGKRPTQFMSCFVEEEEDEVGAGKAPTS